MSDKNQSPIRNVTPTNTPTHLFNVHRDMLILAVGEIRDTFIERDDCLSLADLLDRLYRSHRAILSWLPEAKGLCKVCGGQHPRHDKCVRTSKLLMKHLLLAFELVYDLEAYAAMDRADYDLYHDIADIIFHGYIDGAERKVNLRNIECHHASHNIFVYDELTQSNIAHI